MPKMTIQIAKLEAPSVDAAGRKFGAKAYDTEGTKYTVPKAMFGMLQNGGWYEIFYEDKSYQGKPYKEIQTANATAPLTQPAGNGGAPIVRARTAKEDEEQINERHRLTWIGERLDAVSAQLPLKFEGVFPVAEMFASVYDGLRFKEQPAEGGGLAPKRAAYGTGPAPGGDDMSDEIPFITATGII